LDELIVSTFGRARFKKRGPTIEQVNLLIKDNTSTEADMRDMQTIKRKTRGYLSERARPIATQIRHVSTFRTHVAL
jgi:hypothetical protein